MRRTLGFTESDGNSMPATAGQLPSVCRLYNRRERSAPQHIAGCEGALNGKRSVVAKYIVNYKLGLNVEL